MAIKNLLENNPQCRLALICTFSFVSALSSIPITAPLMSLLFPVRLFLVRPFPVRPISIRLFSVSCASGATPQNNPSRAIGTGGIA